MLRNVPFVNESTTYIGCIPNKILANLPKVLPVNHKDPVGESFYQGSSATAYPGPNVIELFMSIIYGFS
jgi:hypothetical protein